VAPFPGIATCFRGLLAALAPLGCVACSDTIALGSECPQFALECERDLGRAGGSDAGSDDGSSDDPDEPYGPDGGSGSPGVPAPPSDEPDADAGASGDGPDDALILNGSFETTSLSPLLGTLQIANWDWCQGDVAVSDSFDGHDASDGSSLVSLEFGIGFPVLSQELQTPLIQGVSYTLAVDAGRSGEGPDELRLVIYGGDESCAETWSLVRSDPISKDGELHTYCLTFTPARDAPYIVLAVDPLALSGAVYLDNVRFDARCTP
jgi:hypothetical protein